MAVVWVFPGTGAQRKGRGVELLDAYPGLCAEAEDVLGHGVREVLLAEEDSPLRRVPFLQPATFVVNACTYLTRIDTEPPPDFLAGHSLGEYNALFAAGSLDWGTGLRLVRRRAELMQRPTGGAMMAVVGLTVDELTDTLARLGAHDVDVANHNSETQAVLAGPVGSIRSLAGTLRTMGAAKCVPLPAEGAGHSRYLQPLAGLFGELLDRTAFAEPRIPVISNVTARPHVRAEIPRRLREHLYRPVRWWDTMRHLVDAGVDELVEVGPSQVLTKLWRSVLSSSPAPNPFTVAHR